MNPALTSYLTELIGEGFKTDGSELEKFLKYKDDATVYSHLEAIKLQNKQRLADYIRTKNGINVDPTSLFDVQAKRLHEYKRQLLNALHIYDLYRRVKYHG